MKTPNREPRLHRGLIELVKASGRLREGSTEAPRSNRDGTVDVFSGRYIRQIVTRRSMFRNASTISLAICYSQLGAKFAHHDDSTTSNYWIEDVGTVNFLASLAFKLRVHLL